MPTDWVQSAAFMLRTAAVAEIGGFDPDFFVYGEDMDLCRRLADAGWHTLWVPSARVVHHEFFLLHAAPIPASCDSPLDRVGVPAIVASA